MLTVVIPVYNVEATLQRCVSSVVGQTYNELQIVLVDDGATDRSGAMCDEWAAKDLRITVIHKANGGLSSARNAGIEVAQGEFITFVDSDDYLAADTYEKALAAFTETIDIVEFPVWKFYGSPRQQRLTFANTVYHATTDYWLRAQAYTHSYAWNKVYRTHLFRHVRFPVGRVFEDIQTLPLLLRHTRDIATISEGLYYYCYNPSGITATADGHALAQLLQAHIDHFAPITDETYYLHVLNIQLDVARLTDSPPILHPLHIAHPFRQGLKNALKLLMLNVIGIKRLCSLYELRIKSLELRISPPTAD